MKFIPLLLVVLGFASVACAADNLKLNPKLNYKSDSQDGALITGVNIDAGFVQGKPAYVIMYGERCFNSKRQARRTVELYERYKGQVQFVIIDLDQRLSPAQEELKKKFYAGYIPHVVVLDSAGNAIYNSSGEVEESAISRLLDRTLR